MQKLEVAKKELHNELQNRLAYAYFEEHYQEEKEQFFKPLLSDLDDEPNSDDLSIV